MCRVQRNGLAWLGRLIIKPRRLWRRTLIGNPLFLWRVVKQQPALSAPVLSAVEGSKGLGLLHFDGV